MNKTTDELVMIVLDGIGGQQKSMARWALHELAARAHLHQALAEPGDDGLEQWNDLYAEGGVRVGHRCESIHPEWPLTRCMNTAGHDVPHRHTSGADGRSVSWA